MIKIHVINDQNVLQEALDLRAEVFVTEQKVPATDEVDYLDNMVAIGNGSVIHVVAISDQQIAGTARLILDVPEGEYPHIGQIGRAHV